MPGPPKKQHHSIRLKGYDYRQPCAYFVTICTRRWQHLFGEIFNGQMIRNAIGKIVAAEWQRTAEIRTYVHLDEYVVMPNHLHGIVMITESGRGTASRALTTEQFGQPVPGSLPTIIRAFKSATTKRVNRLRRTPGHPVWQRNYFEHVIRTDHALNRIRTYIPHNSARWHLDQYNAATAGRDDFDRWLLTVRTDT